MSDSPAKPLEVALAAQKPIADAPRQPLEVELLLTESQRVTVDQHAAWIESFKPKREDSDE